MDGDAGQGQTAEATAVRTARPAMQERVGTARIDDCTGPQHCPMMQLLGMLSGKWSFPILYRLILRNGPIRFGELQRQIGRITQKELTRHLRQFEALGLVEREVFAEVPPRVEYRITAFGLSLKPPLDGLALWVEDHRDAIAACLPGMAGGKAATAAERQHSLA